MALGRRYVFGNMSPLTRFYNGYVGCFIFVWDMKDLGFWPGPYVHMYFELGTLLTRSAYQRE